MEYEDAKEYKLRDAGWLNKERRKFFHPANLYF